MSAKIIDVVLERIRLATCHREVVLLLCLDIKCQQGHWLTGGAEVSGLRKVSGASLDRISSLRVQREHLIQRRVVTRCDNLRVGLLHKLQLTPVQRRPVKHT